MSQQGFPGNFIMPDDNADFNYSNLIISRNAIESAAEEFRGDSFNNQYSDPNVADDLRTQISGLATAALMLAQYYIQQTTYQLPNGPGTPGNPIEVPYDDEVKCKFIQSLGSNPSASGLFNNYQNHSRNLDGVANVFHVLGQKQGAFHWMPDGSLEIRDTYLFTGMDDLGAAPTIDQRKKFIETDKEERVRILYREEIIKFFADSDLSSKVSVVFGGQTSFDIYPFNWDKTYQVSRELKGCTLWFVGDQCGPGGNDRTLYNHLNPSERSFSTSGPKETIRILKNKILPKISV